MTRKEFFARVGIGAAVVLMPACIAGLATSCSSSDDSSDGGSSTPQPPPTSNFTVDTSTGALAANGGFVVMNGIIIARTNTGTFLAVSSLCTHESVTLNYNKDSNQFACPRHNSQFSSTGTVLVGPASSNLRQYQTTLSGSTLTVIV